MKEESKNTRKGLIFMTFSYDIYSLGIMAAVISFLGFTLENIWLAATKGYIDNRNMYLPFLFGYGMAVTGMYIVLGTPENIVFFGKYHPALSQSNSIMLYFLLAMAIVSIGEIVLGYTVEKLCGFEYWNYTWIPLHITKYTSIPTSMGFALIITAFMGLCFDPIMETVSGIPQPAAKYICIVLIGAMSADFAVSFHKMYSRQSLNCRWQLSFENGKPDFRRNTV